MDREYYRKKVKHLVTSGELKDDNNVTKLISEILHDDEIYEETKSDWDRFFVDEIKEERDLNHILDKLHSEIYKLEHEKQNNWKNRFLQSYYKVAAVLLLPLLIAGSYLYMEAFKTENELAALTSFEVHAPDNSRVKCVLPDSSVVWLNSASSISYSSNFNSDRKIDLKGKAYFEVVHKVSNKPFIVNFLNGEVDVLGTKFYISSRENGNFNVVLLEGSVDAKLKRESMKEKSILLKPNTMLVSTKNGNVVKNVNAKNLVAWIDGKLVYRNTPLKYVFTRMSDFYGVDIVLEDHLLNKLSYWGEFKDEDIEEVLRLMSMTLPIRFKVLPRKKNKDGVYSKKKVIIYNKINN